MHAYLLRASASSRMKEEVFEERRCPFGGRNASPISDYCTDFSRNPMPGWLGVDWNRVEEGLRAGEDVIERRKEERGMVERRGLGCLGSEF